MTHNIHNTYMSGFVAAQYSLRFSPATNEGDYDWPFWLGFMTARMLEDINKEWKEDDIFQYGEPDHIVSELKKMLAENYRT